MAEKILVSIILNNHNYCRFLEEAIESALAQTYPDVEVIVVDDGSQDDSIRVIRAYQSRVVGIYQPQGGQASALNTGFAHSHGDLIIFLDADDRLQPEAARRVVEAFQHTPEAAKIQYRMAVIDGQGRLTGEVKPQPHLPLMQGDLRSQALAFPLDVPWQPTSGNCFPARILHRIFPIPEQEWGPVGADWYLAHLTPLLGPVVFLEETLACYRVHSGNAYERTAGALDLNHLRQTIRYSRLAQAHIHQLAEETGLQPPPEILSVCDVANRLVSCKIDPGAHLAPGDSPAKLLRLGATAVKRRFDVPLPMKLLFLAWFAAEACAPRPVARWLAELFIFPERRAGANRLLAKLHRGVEAG